MIKAHKKLERLMLFSEVATYLSFTTAAEKLDISRGHLSAQVRRLEKDMGMLLLIRSTRSVRLTAEGERVLTGMNKIRDDILELERNAEQEGKAIAGLIKITAPRLFSERFLLDICSQFKVLHPDITFSLDSSYTNYDLNSSNYDLAFRATNEPPQNMIAKPLFSYKHYCCASPEYFKKFGKPKKINDLKKHQCLRGPDQPFWQFIDEKTPANGWLEINDNHMLKSLALQGKGIVRVAEYWIDEEIKKGKLEVIFADDMPTGMTIFMIHPQLIHQSNRLTTFIEFTRDYFNKNNTKI